MYSLESGDSETVRVKLNCAGVDTAWSMPVEKNCRPPITISIKELLSTAEKMAEICPGDPCFTILKTNILKEVNGSTVQPCSELTIREVVNMVGMVGAGKSTLIKVLSFWFHQHGLRMAVVVDTVAETLSLQKYLSSLGVAASPLIGRSERMKYINQVSQPDEICLSASYSQYLTPACLIDGMDEQHDAAIVFGKEPCYSLKKGNQHYLCPYFEQCSGTKMLRDCYTASVVVTTVAGFAASRVGTARETLLELAMRDFDLVVFDESDRVQKTLDHFFMPETSFNNYGIDSKTKYNQVANYIYLDTQVNKAISDDAPCDYFSKAFMQCETKAIELGNICNLSQLNENLQENCIPLSVKNMDASSYEEFLTERRKLMAFMMKRYYWSL